MSTKLRQGRERKRAEEGNMGYKLNRLDTGTPGWNEILHGGLPAGQMYLLEGDPGTGKTTLAMQFIRQGELLGEKGLYVTLSEPVAELQGSMLSHGWDVNSIPVVEFTPTEALDPDQQYTVFHPSEVELLSTIRRLIEVIEEQRPKRLVIDSLSELHLLASDDMRYRRQLLALKQFFAGRETTVLLLDDRTTGRDIQQLRSIAHGVISLDKVARSFGKTRRQVEVIKLRGSAYREGVHDYGIEYGGVVIYPRLVAAEHSTDFKRERIKSGLAALDDMFGGGIARGTSTLLIGPTGVGKSTIALQYAHAAAARGDRAIVYAFDEIVRTATERGEALGMKITEEIERGNLSMRQVDPAELSPGEFFAQIRKDVDEEDTRVVVIDSLNGFQYAMPGERDLTLHLHELVAYLNQKGVITFMIMTQSGMVGAMQTDMDVSYLSDTVVLLRYFEIAGEVRQVISVLKQRVGLHERTLRELHLDKNGLSIGAPLNGFQGVLTGVPQVLGGEGMKQAGPPKSSSV